MRWVLGLALLLGPSLGHAWRVVVPRPIQTTCSLAQAHALRADARLSDLQRCAERCLGARERDCVEKLLHAAPQNACQQAARVATNLNSANECVRLCVAAGPPFDALATRCRVIAERILLSRGTSMPPVASNEGLSVVTASRVIERHRSEYRYCYDKALNPDLRGLIRARIRVSPNGGVDDAIIDSSTLQNAPTESCLIFKIKRWVFPAPKGGRPVDIWYTFDFTFGKQPLK